MRTWTKTVAMVGACATVFLCSATSVAEQLPAGSDLLDGVALNVSEHGFDFLEAQLPGAVPSELPLDEMSGELFSCLFDTNDYTIKNILVFLQINDVQITPGDGVLDVFIDGLVAAEARVETDGCLFNNGCQAEIDWSQIQADTTIGLQMIPDPAGGLRPVIDATVPAFNINLNLGSPNISGCTLAGFFEFLADVLLGVVEGAVEGLLQDQLAGELEPLIEDAFNSITIADNLELLGAEIAYELFPSDLTLATEGMTLVMGTNFSAVEPHKCAKGGPGGSLLTINNRPTYTGDVSPTGTAYDFAASISDDMANQALFALWEAGLLCIDISELMGSEPLTSDILALLGGEVTRTVTPGGKLAITLSAPGGPPVATIVENGALIDVDDLRLNLVADVHDRMSRLMEIKVRPEIGATVEIANNQIIPTIDFDTSDLQPEIMYNELLPETGPVILTLLPTMLDSFLPSLALDPFDLPDLAGITLDYTEVMEDGPGADFLSIYTGLGGQLDATGCAGGGSGCGGGLACTISGKRTNVPFAPLMLFAGFALVLIRRRKGA